MSTAILYIIISVTGRLALHVYGAGLALLYTYYSLIVMISVTGRLALHVYGAGRALGYTRTSPQAGCMHLAFLLPSNRHCHYTMLRRMNEKQRPAECRRYTAAEEEETEDDYSKQKFNDAPPSLLELVQILVLWSTIYKVSDNTMSIFFKSL